MVTLKTNNHYLFFFGLWLSPRHGCLIQDARRRSNTAISVRHTDLATLSLRDLAALGRDFPASGGIVRVRGCGCGARSHRTGLAVAVLPGARVLLAAVPVMGARLQGAVT